MVLFIESFFGEPKSVFLYGIAAKPPHLETFTFKSIWCLIMLPTSAAELILSYSAIHEMVQPDTPSMLFPMISDFLFVSTYDAYQ